MHNEEYELYHYGIMGQKWGVRRFQNEDGTLTAEGKMRYGLSDISAVNKDFSARNGNKKAVKERDKRYRVINKAEKEEYRTLQKEADEKYGKKRSDIKDKFLGEESRKIAEAAWTAKATVDDYLYSKYGEFSQSTVKKIKQEKPKEVDSGKSAVGAVLLTAGLGAMAYGLIKRSRNS